MNRPIFSILTLKLVANATSLDQKKKARIIYDQYLLYGENFVKIAQVDPEIIGLKGLIF